MSTRITSPSPATTFAPAASLESTDVVEPPEPSAADDGPDAALLAGKNLPSAAWVEAKLKSEAACLLPPRQALTLARNEMPAGGLGQMMLNHFLAGGGGVVRVDLTRELERNPRLQQLLASRIETEVASALSRGEPLERAAGAIWVTQGDYGASEAGMDQRFAFGATFFEYRVVGTAAGGGLVVELTVSDHYLWSPGEDRPTKCLHAAGAKLARDKEAIEFHQLGKGQMVIADPHVTAPAAEPPPEEVEAT